MDIPYTADKRPDTGVSNATLGLWLFLASEAMLFGSLFSAYALLRSGAAAWPDQSTLINIPLGAINTLILLASSFTIARARRAAPDASPTMLVYTAVLGAVFLGIKAFEWSEKLAAGLTPAMNNFLGLYYAMTGLHALHLLGGVLVVAHLAGPGAPMRVTAPARYASRVHVTALYCHFVDAIWIVLFAVLYLL